MYISRRFSGFSTLSVSDRIRWTDWCSPHPINSNFWRFEFRRIYNTRYNKYLKKENNILLLFTVPALNNNFQHTTIAKQKAAKRTYMLISRGVISMGAWCLVTPLLPWYCLACTLGSPSSSLEGKPASSFDHSSKDSNGWGNLLVCLLNRENLFLWRFRKSHRHSARYQADVANRCYWSLQQQMQLLYLRDRSLYFFHVAALCILLISVVSLGEDRRFLLQPRWLWGGVKLP